MLAACLLEATKLAGWRRAPLGYYWESFLLLLLPVALNKVYNTFEGLLVTSIKRSELQLYNEIILFWPSSSKVFIKGFISALVAMQ